MNLNTASVVVGLIYTILSTIIIFYSLRRDNKADDTTEASTITTIMVKLENINTGIAELKAEISLIKTEQQNDHDKIIRLEQSLSSAWKEIDRLRKSIEGTTTRPRDN